ncbi:hypothetical protein O181_046920 [Austropuccinia psidii MF-1]|uniref:Uncharacterized protein n=1 Tax=Austropuccinia psidii MF-1 TaxID=1389203 RepID=A0A9Q3HMP4_9BASI|nr:hypothetical protein [Austropuccinia psidii MF-1]
MSFTLCTKRGIPCIRSSTMTNACDAFQQAHKKCLFVVQPFQPPGQRSSCPRCPCEDSFVVDNDESIPEREWTPETQTGLQEQFQTICPVPSSIDLSTPLLGHHPMVTSHLDRSKVIIRPMKDGNGERTFELGPIVTMSCHPWDSNAKNKTHLIPPTRLTHSMYAFPTCEPEPEVAPTQSTEEPFAHPATPCSVIIIDDMPVRSLTPPPSPSVTSPSTPTPENPNASSPHSHNDACQEFTNFKRL